MTPLDQIILGAMALCVLVIAASMGSILLDRLRARRRLAGILADARKVTS